jgi:hypothetical protein
MQAQSTNWLAQLWTTARQNDLPNWFAAAFSLVMWPLALLAWNRRRSNNIPGLEVRFAPGSISIDSQPHSAIDIQFINHTGSVTYVSGGRIRECTRAFSVPTAAARDIAANSYHLKFMGDDGAFSMREVTIQTGNVAKTCIAVSTPPTQEFFSYITPWHRRLFRRPKYFVLEYDAMVGTNRRRVATLY